MSATPLIPDGANINDAEEIVIDGVRPTIESITSSSKDTTYGIGDNINVTITFSESVTLATANLDLVLNSGYTLPVLPFSTSNTTQATYEVLVGHQSADLAVTGNPTLAAGATLKDNLDNSPNDMEDFTIPAGKNISDAHAIVVDGIRPFVQSVTSPLSLIHI